jgi:cytochrome b561
MFTISSGAALYGERLAVALGYITLISAMATFASCRSCLSFLGRFGLKSPVDKNWYRPFYKLHGYYWWIFLFALSLHLLTAMMHTALPTASDPDARIHWIILASAFFSLLLAAVVLSSCRSLAGLLSMFAEKGPMSNKSYLSFYRYHSYYWLAFIASVAGHFAAAYVHVGIWPR